MQNYSKSCLSLNEVYFDSPEKTPLWVRRILLFSYFYYEFIDKAAPIKDEYIHEFKN